MVNMSQYMLVVLVVIVCIHVSDGQKKLSQLATANKHFMEGTVFIKDDNTIEIKCVSWDNFFHE